MAERVAWAGRLDHAELADLLPAAEAMAVPSTFPEAFGMVAAEAAACGALPVVAAHSGLAEVAAHARRGRPRAGARVADLRGRARRRRASWPTASRAGSRRPTDAARRHARGDRRGRPRALLWDGVARTVDRRRRRGGSTSSRALSARGRSRRTAGRIRAA